MGGHHASVAMKKSVPRLRADLPRAGPSGHLLPGLDRMGHAAGHPAMTERQQASVRVERQPAIRAELAAAQAVCRATTGCEADFFEQHCQCDRERVIDAQVVDVCDAEAGLVEGPGGRLRRHRSGPSRAGAGAPAPSRR